MPPTFHKHFCKNEQAIGMVPQEELGTPALAFVRTVCEALSLDKEVEAEVAVLRRNLLRLTHTREFAEAAKFQVSPERLRERAEEGAHVHTLRSKYYASTNGSTQQCNQQCCLCVADAVSCLLQNE